MSSKIPIMLFLVLLLAMSALPQQPVSPSSSEIVERAAAQRKAYLDEFKNLISVETKSLELYDKRGEVKKRQSIMSTFIVYQLSKQNDAIVEYRHVTAVNGKTLDQAESRSQSFFEKIVKAENSKAELRKIQTESLRFDEDIVIDGLTLFQSVALSDNLRPAFDFTLEGEETINGVRTYRVAYRQTRKSPRIGINSPDSGNSEQLTLVYEVDLDDITDYGERLEGKLWIDAETFRTRAEERRMTMQPDGFAARVTLAETKFEFTDSDFGILTPKKIVHTQYRIRRKDAPRKEATVTFDYGKFSKPDVEVKSSEVK